MEAVGKVSTSTDQKSETKEEQVVQTIDEQIETLKEELARLHEKKCLLLEKRCERVALIASRKNRMRQIEQELSNLEKES
ncbi:hypothetical protein AgCh_000995 [Apium graveolens]